MTLPTIEEPEHEQKNELNNENLVCKHCGISGFKTLGALVSHENETHTCPDCGKDGLKNVGSHMRFCKGDKEDKYWKKCPECGETGFVDIGKHKRFCKANKADEKITEPEQEKEQPAQLEAPIIISGLTDINTLMNAWYDVDNELTHIPIEVAGIMKSDGHETSWGLVMSPNGMLVPPYMLPGFVCVSIHPPKTQTEEPDNTESFPPFPVEEEETEITDSNNNVVVEQIKQPSLLSRVFGRKPQPAKQPISCDTRDLLKEVVNG